MHSGVRQRGGEGDGVATIWRRFEEDEIYLVMRKELGLCCLNRLRIHNF